MEEFSEDDRRLIAEAAAVVSTVQAAQEPRCIVCGGRSVLNCTVLSDDADNPGLIAFSLCGPCVSQRTMAEVVTAVLTEQVDGKG